MGEPALVIAPDDPGAPDVVVLLERHLELMRSASPPGFSFALDVGELAAPRITFCSARRDGVLLAVGALKELDPTHGELKSMHTTAAARRQGIGATMLEHLLELARRRGYRRVSLETGSQPAFEAGRALYAAAGFEVCPAFGGYPDSPNSVFMTRQP